MPGTDWRPLLSVPDIRAGSSSDSGIRYVSQTTGFPVGFRQLAKRDFRVRVEVECPKCHYRVVGRDETFARALTAVADTGASPVSLPDFAAILRNAGQSATG